jgi:hypothetical protein
VAELDFIKSSVGLLPVDDPGKAWFRKMPMGTTVTVKVTIPVNGKFRRKFFAMLHASYDNYDWQEVMTKWGPCKTDFETFRKYVTCKAGFYEMVLHPIKGPQAQPRSIAWAKMKDAEFEKLYSSVLDVILAEFLTNWKRGDLDNAVNHMLSFA